MKLVVVTIMVCFVIFVSCSSQQEANSEQENSDVRDVQSAPKDEEENRNNTLNEEIVYDRYCNARYDYCIDYPKDILIPQGESENGDGQVFQSDDGKRKLTVWGELNVLDETLEIKMEDNLETVEDARHELNEDYFIIKGIRNGSNYYQKTKLIEDGFATFLLEYPDDKKGSCEKVVLKISASF